jgi:hypothetical protein
MRCNACHGGGACGETVEMADEAQVQLLLRDLGKLVGLGELGLDADGRCRLLIDGRLEIEISTGEGDDRLILAALVGELKADAPPELYATLLDANFFWRGTNGATLGVERESRTVVLLETLPLAGLDIGRLEGRLQAFVNSAEAWVERLADAPAGDGIVAGDAASRPPEFMLRA